MPNHFCPEHYPPTQNMIRVVIWHPFLKIEVKVEKLSEIKLPLEKRERDEKIVCAILPDCGESSSSEESFLWSLPFPPFLSLQKNMEENISIKTE